MKTVLIFQGVFPPIVSWETFKTCIEQDILNYIDKETLLNLQQNNIYSLYDLVQVTHAVNISKFLKWKKENELNKETYFSGFSIGIYAALYASQLISLKDSFSLIRTRANILMKAVHDEWNIYSISGIKLEVLKKLEAKGEFFLSTISSGKHASIAVHVNNEKNVFNEFKNIGYVSLVRLFTNAAWHTPVIVSQKEPLTELFNKYNLPLNNKVFFSQNVTKQSSLAGILLEDCIKTVNWQNTLQTINSMDIFPIFFDETNSLEKIWYTNLKNKNYKVIRCAQL